MITVLVVDDETNNRDQFVAFVRVQGYACEGCTYAEAVSQLAEFRPPVIILAVVNETVSEEQFKQLTDYSVNYEKLPVIAVSMSGTMALEQWIAAGASDYLLEPYHAAALKLRIEASAEKWQDNVFARWFHYIPYEVHNPLASLNGYLQILLKKLPQTETMVFDEEKRMLFYKMMLRNTLHLTNVLEQFRFAAWVESGVMSIRSETFDFGALLAAVIKKYEQEIADKQLQLDWLLPEQSLYLKGEERRVEMVLNTILDNAIRFTPEHGKITIGVDLPAKQAGSLFLANKTGTLEQLKMLHVSVSDTGIGIQETEFARIFSAFWRSPETKVQELRGFGLNLYIAKGIIELHGGKMWFESAYNEGSTFHFTLPAAEN